MIEAKMPWFAENPFFIQQDGARPHTANGTIEDLEAGGNGDEFVPNILRQRPHDLGSFPLVKVDVKRICTHSSR